LWDLGRRIEDDVAIEIVTREYPGNDRAGH
jgi:hypothetical protein